eukprot:CAMPEP_0119401264 /NCGR_PEP_ID=MMETSP1334-20130426/142283_1 /TAXON_ID=127549 /ORGANISM="Calcidiscus leptoporus, Strain RCC1130" /LENGTH=173 /DNA_ID=CAMNT_0007425179 /DNA_START=239 /DNA_END=758 /DNA_ORIENTATION=-
MILQAACVAEREKDGDQREKAGIRIGTDGRDGGHAAISGKRRASESERMAETVGTPARGFEVAPITECRRASAQSRKRSVGHSFSWDATGRAELARGRERRQEPERRSVSRGLIHSETPTRANQWIQRASPHCDAMRGENAEVSASYSPVRDRTPGAQPRSSIAAHISASASP